jgi:hypothetical protein
VIWENETHARLAVFQAKKGTVKVPEGTNPSNSSTWEFDIHRLPRKKPEGEQRPSQLSMLFETAKRASSYVRDFEQARRATASGTAPARGEASEAIGQPDLSWLHYVVYAQGQPRTIAVSELHPDAVEKELRNDKGQTLVSLPRGENTFFKTIRSGLQAGKPTGWLRLPGDVVNKLVVDLVDFIDVFVGEEGGQRCLEAKASTENIFNLHTQADEPQSDFGDELETPTPKI